MQFRKIAPNNMAINPVPLASLLKAAISSGAKQIKIGGVNKKLVAVPMSIMPKSVAAASLNFVKPAKHFLVPKGTGKPASSQVIRLSSVQRLPPKVIDLDSDDEPVILDNGGSEMNNSAVTDDNVIITDEIEEIEETIEVNSIADADFDTDVETAAVTTQTNRVRIIFHFFVKYFRIAQFDCKS